MGIVHDKPTAPRRRDPLATEVSCGGKKRQLRYCPAAFAASVLRGMKHIAPHTVLSLVPLPRIAWAPVEVLAADDPLRLRRKISVRKAAEINTISEATFRRRYPHLIRKVSPRRDAVELGDAINLPPPP